MNTQPSNQDTQDKPTNTGQESETNGTDTNEYPGKSPDLPIKTRPTIRPTIVWVFLTVAVGSVLALYISMNVEKIGGPHMTEVAIQVVVVIALLIVARFAIRAYILTRTTYEISENHVRREYTLLMRTRAQVVPTEVIRSIEMRQSRVQKLMGYGTITINQGLGDIRLENLLDPHSTQEMISDVVELKSKSDL